MHQNIAVILVQFNYSKNSFAVLIPGCRMQALQDVVLKRR